MDATPVNSDGNEYQLTVVLNAMGRLELADLGFRSWMLQKWDRPYHVVLSLFNDQQPRYEALTAGKNPNCHVMIRSYERPGFFNISAANNLGLHFARGKYVMFANSDIIYPSYFGQRFADYMDRHRLGYAVGSRYNLTQQQTEAMKPAAQYTMESNLDVLDNEWKHVAPLPVWYTCGPWVARRDVIRAIGGFDPTVLVSEDDDVNARAVHYLARHGEQHVNVSLMELWGYHLYHPTSELFDWHREAHEIIDARRDRLRRDPDSTEDVITTNRLDDLDSLVEEIRRTPKPKAMKRYREDTIRKIGRRFIAAGKVLLGRR